MKTSAKYGLATWFGTLLTFYLGMSVNEHSGEVEKLLICAAIGVGILTFFGGITALTKLVDGE